MCPIRVAAALAVLTVGVSMFLKDAPRDEVACGEDVSGPFSSSTVLQTDSGGIRSAMATIMFRDVDNSVCIAETHEENQFTSLLLAAQHEEYPSCCTDEENAKMTNKIHNGVLSPWAQSVFDSIRQRTLSSVTFYEVVPPPCTAAAPCPLVFEISGNGGNPWALTLISCEKCYQEMHVVMVAPILGSDFETDEDFINGTFLPWAREYVDQSQNIDPARVILSSVSRGNDIAFQAAIFASDLFGMIVLTGKFRMSSKFQAMLKNPEVFGAAVENGLRRITFYIGDLDDILPDEEFYSNLTSVLSTVAHSETAPDVQLRLYEGAPHDIIWTTSSEAYDFIWAATAW